MIPVRIPWGIAFLAIVFLLSLCVAPDRGVEGSGGQHCGPYESVCRQALLDFGFGDDPELLAYVHDTIHCESRFDPLVRGHADPRDRGLVQINAFWHPDVTDAQAFDPVFSIRYMVWHWRQGHAAWWGCYVLLRDQYGTPAALRLSAVPFARSMEPFSSDRSFGITPVPRWLAELHRVLSLQSHPATPPPFWPWGGIP